MLNFFGNYKLLSPQVKFMVAGQATLQLINATFVICLNLYMAKEGYNDPEIGAFASLRFLAIMLLAFPLGFFIRGKALKPLFIIAGITVPLFALLLTQAVGNNNNAQINLFMLLWGVSFALMRVSSLPFVLRNVQPQFQQEAISLNYSTWSFTMFLAGIFGFVSLTYFPVLFSEAMLLKGSSIIGFASVIFFVAIGKKEIVNKEEKKTTFNLKQYDWASIGKALAPNLIIAVGAGLTIQFINLFFYNVYGMDTSTFSLIVSLTAILIFGAALITPYIKKRFDYEIGITFVQSLAILCLIILATTQFYSHLGIALIIAVVFFIIRQPLMNMAGPITTDLAMNYVGKKNHEIIAALSVSMWSGSWFISGQIFKWLRSMNLDYVYIFLITAVLYTVAVFMYYLLIKSYKKRLANA